MGLFKRVLDKLTGSRSSDEGMKMPWDQEPSIYAHIQARLNSSGVGLSDGGMELPDEKQADESTGIRFAPGTMDGIMTHHFGAENATDQAAELLQLINAYCRAPTVANKLKTYQFLKDKE